MKKSYNRLIKIIFVVGIILGTNCAFWSQVEAQRLSQPGKKKISRITLKNLSPPCLGYNYFRDVKEYGFRFNATSFNLINTWWLAEISILVYAAKGFVRTQFNKAGLQELKH
jgi:hypothetical protein